MKISKITESSAFYLAGTNEQVFVKNTTPPEYITYPDTARLSLAEGEYTSDEITEDECQNFSLMMFHYIKEGRSYYITREDVKPQP